MAGGFYRQARVETLATVGGLPGCALNFGVGICGAFFGNWMSGAWGATVGAALGFVAPMAALYVYNLITAQTRHWRARAESAEAELAQRKPQFDGEWLGNEFVFSERRHIKTIKFEPGHRREHVIVFPDDIPVGASVRCTYDVDPGKNGGALRIGFMPNRDTFDKKLRPELEPANIDSYRRATLFMDKAMEADGMTLRIYATSWEQPY
jgi:uncharacterized membrane protein YeaQ/YmgE (transglycosylase-associated protein family)